MVPFGQVVLEEKSFEKLLTTTDDDGSDGSSSHGLWQGEPITIPWR